jgi:hypothetical protein
MVMAATGGMSRLFISEDTIMAKRGCGCPKGAKRVKGGGCQRKGRFVAKKKCSR